MNDRYDSVLRPGLFAGELHWVTGGGSGIGRCVAHELASLGAIVVLSGRSQDKLDSVAAEIAEDGGRCETLAFDIRDEEAVKAAVAGVVARHGRIHGLVNNAGGQFAAPLAGNLTMTAALEWAASGVRVNAVAPGWIASSGMDRYGGAMKAVIPTLHEHVPLKRLGLEAEVSAAICFLLSPGAAFITGVTLQIDGGAPLSSALWEVAEAHNVQVFEGFHRAVTPDVLK
jgi:citronellol/citronellal dehydrogenase